jgi:hypothetical protein
MEYVEARVSSLQYFSKHYGDRIYAVFELPNGQKYGMWAASDQKVFLDLKVGDRVLLERSARGNLKLVHRKD